VRRRQFILLGVAASVAWPGAARSEEPAPLLGVVSFASREATLQSSWYRAFHERMIDLGWAGPQAQDRIPIRGRAARQARGFA
jgi:hypothetical protein